MFCFKLWSRFGAFRDPLTITQNLTFPIPPKTTIGGMLAAVLGIDYSDYFNDPDYFNFLYSMVLARPVRKKSLAQNYVADYTKVSESKFNTIADFGKKREKLQSLQEKKETLEKKKEHSKSEKTFLSSAEAKIEAAQKAVDKSINKCTLVMEKGFRSPKPIFRELLMEPGYLIFIKNFKYEDQAIACLKNHESVFSLYMGNSEFAANYRFLEHTCKEAKSCTCHSFTQKGSQIRFEAGKKYTKVFMATRSCAEREYMDYKQLILCDQPMNMKDLETMDCIECQEGAFYCEFI